MSNIYLLRSQILDDALSCLRELFHKVEAWSQSSIEAPPGLIKMERELGYILTERLVEHELADYRLSSLFDNLPYARKRIRFHIFPNTPESRSGISCHMDKSPQEDPCSGLQSTSLNFGIEGCTDNTVTNWYAMLSAKYPDDFIFEGKHSYLGLAISNMTGMKCIQSYSLLNNQAYLFRTNRYHSVKTQHLNGQRRVLAAIHFTNAGIWDDYVEQMRIKNWLDGDID